MQRAREPQLQLSRVLIYIKPSPGSSFLTLWPVSHRLVSEVLDLFLLLHHLVLSAGCVEFAPVLGKVVEGKRLGEHVRRHGPCSGTPPPSLPVTASRDGGGAAAAQCHRFDASWGEEKHHQKTKKPEAYGYADYDDEILLQFGGGHVGVVLSGRRLQFGLGRIKTPSRRRWLVGS